MIMFRQVSILHCSIEIWILGMYENYTTTGVYGYYLAGVLSLAQGWPLRLSLRERIQHPHMIHPTPDNARQTPFVLYHASGIYVPFAHANPRLGFNAAVAFKQTTVGISEFSGNSSILVVSKFEHDVLVLHSMMMASVYLRSGRPTSYQQGCITNQQTSQKIRESLRALTSVTQDPSP